MVRRATGTFAPACFLQETKGVCEPKTLLVAQLSEERTKK